MRYYIYVACCIARSAAERMGRAIASPILQRKEAKRNEVKRSAWREQSERTISRSA